MVAKPWLLRVAVLVEVVLLAAEQVERAQAERRVAVLVVALELELPAVVVALAEGREILALAELAELAQAGLPVVEQVERAQTGLVQVAQSEAVLHVP